MDGAASAAEFYLLIPDPNLNGPNAVLRSASTAEGEALFQRGIDSFTALRDVRFTQWIAEAGATLGRRARGDHRRRNTPPGFTYRAAGGMEAVIIGSTRWIRLPGDPGWEEQEGATVVLPSAWDEEYFGATGFTILGEETIDGERCQLLAFVVPELSEPRRTVAWYCGGSAKRRATCAGSRWFPASTTCSTLQRLRRADRARPTAGRRRPRSRAERPSLERAGLDLRRRRPREGFPKRRRCC